MKASTALAGVGLGLGIVLIGGIGWHIYKGVTTPPEFDSGTGTEQHIYRGVPFLVAYFSDWYNGTGWRFRYINGVPYFARGSTDWAGGFNSKAAAIASAQYTVDLKGQDPCSATLLPGMRRPEYCVPA